MKIRPEGVKPIRALRIGIGLQILCRREEPIFLKNLGPWWMQKWAGRWEIH